MIIVKNDNGIDVFLIVQLLRNIVFIPTKAVYQDMYLLSLLLILLILIIIIIFDLFFALCDKFLKF